MRWLPAGPGASRTPRTGWSKIWIRCVQIFEVDKKRRMPRRLPAAVLPQVRQRQLASPYGKSHVASLKPRRLPPPVVPLFPQKVMLSDGSTFTHYTTSPRSSVRLTKDISNSPLWTLSSQRTAEEDLTGRVGRFKQKFEGTGSFGASELAQLETYAQEATNVPKKFKK
jgi:ribosomal protein L31